MARKDEILGTFLNHELIGSKYKVDISQLPKTVAEAQNSDIPIVKAIAFIVDGLEGNPQITDNALRAQIMQFLNEAI